MTRKSDVVKRKEVFKELENTAAIIRQELTAAEFSENEQKGIGLILLSLLSIPDPEFKANHRLRLKNIAETVNFNE